MQQPRIWLVEDEQSIADTLVYMLQQEGFQVSVFGRGLPALEAAAHQAPDVAILDVGLPDISGFELCRRLLTRYPALPVLFLTARSDEVDKLLGLEIGADDYIAKPFSPRELVARIWTRLRRPPVESDTESIRIGDVVINVAAHQVRRGGHIIGLTPLEFDLLLALARRPNQVFSREKLLEDVWGYRHAADTRLVNVHVQRLRSKVEGDPERPEIIVTVRGVGYRAGEPRPVG